jgi:hypothetical protein
METFRALTDFGNFKVIINTVKTINFSTREEYIISYNILIGGKNKCVQIMIPADSKNTIGELMSLDTHQGGCELTDITISGTLTTKMTLLAFTILKGKFPHIKQLKLLDSSRIPCDVDGVQIEVSLALQNYLFYRTTLYEQRFGAYLIDKHLRESYLKSKENFDNPSYKPDYFDFINNDCNTKLYDKYREYNTWSDFFNYINSTYKIQKCKIIYPWMTRVVALLADNIIFSSQYWIIDLYNNNLVYDIIYDKVQLGGNRKRNTKRNTKTKTQRNFDKEFYSRFYKESPYIPFDTIREMNLGKYLQ